MTSDPTDFLNCDFAISQPQLSRSSLFAICIPCRGPEIAAVERTRTENKTFERAGKRALVEQLETEISDDQPRLCVSIFTLMSCVIDVNDPSDLSAELHNQR